MTMPADGTPALPVGVTDSDLTAIRAAGAVRVVIAVVTTVAGVVGAGSWDGRLTALLGLVWLPWTVLTLAAANPTTGRGRKLAFALYGGPAGDVAIVFCAQCLAPGGWGVFLLADALAVSLAASLWRSREAWTLLSACVGLTAAAQAVVPDHERVAAGLPVLFALALGGLVVVVGRIARDHRRAALSSHRFQQKAETILARVGDAIVVTDGSGVVTECNPAGERLMGRDRQ
ncbi:MAG TPA: PAS domain-containing protein, partial [Actinomycetes bacterium]|nr:PAS domain-containing protein [Actinomycetes bacterium]